MNKPVDWFWEGSVQLAIQRSLEKDGWTIRSSADTASKAHGVDLLATLGLRTLAVEVKGYPSTSYADPRRAHETKKTNPINQAGHWYAQALLKAMRMRSCMPQAEIAIGLPDFPRYRNLLTDTEGSLRMLGIGVYLVAEPSAVTLLMLPKGSVPIQEELSPFDGYEGGGRRPLGVPAFGGGSSRRNYGVPVFEQCGWACVYCGTDLNETYEVWLGLSVDHVVPSALVKLGWPAEWVEDMTNKVTCCRHCNEFLNSYRIVEPVPATLEAFYDLRDRVFREKRERAKERHRVERDWYETWRSRSTPPDAGG